jgi:hypothetical protein
MLKTRKRPTDHKSMRAWTLTLFLFGGLAFGQTVSERAMAADCNIVWKHVVPTFAKFGFDPKTADRATGFATFSYRQGQQIARLTQQINAFTNAGANALSNYQRFGIENATFTASDQGTRCRTSAIFDFVGFKYNLLSKGWFKLPSNGVLEARVLDQIAAEVSRDGGGATPATVQSQPVTPTSAQADRQVLQGPPRVKFTSDPSGAEVTVDGEYMGSTPTAEIELKEGSHVIRVRKRGFVVWERTLSLKTGDTRAVSAELDAEPSDPNKPRIVGLN